MKRLALLAALTLVAAPIAAQPPNVGCPASSDWIRRDHPIEITVDRVPTPEEGRIAVLVAGTDVTDLFTRRGGRLVYRPELLPLPVGETEITVFLVDPHGDWSEIGRFPLRVLTRRGFERGRLTPRLDLQGKKTLETDHEPADDPGPEEIESANLQLDLSSEHLRSGWRVTSRLNIQGASRVEEALRFGEKGEDAPQVDLSSYELVVEKGRGSFAVGAVSFGTQRHLIEGFASRGLRLTVPLGLRGTASVAAMNGTSIVGWNNLVGLGDSRHRVIGGELAFDLLKDHPGGLELGLTYLDGSLLPFAGFNQGLVTDTEESHGWGAHLSAATPNRRFEGQASYAWSSFDNPFDPTLAQGADLVGVETEERSAGHAEVRIGILRGARLGESRTADLSLRLVHETVEPQFRSVAAYVQPDQRRNGADLSAILGPVSLAGGYSESEDNLDDIPSILTTRTENSTSTIGIPFAQLGRPDAGPRPWLPSLSIAWNRTHQFGKGLPENGGFSPSHVPDQVSANLVIGLDWSGARWRGGYRLSLTDQDNRQPGREAADFEATVHNATFGLTPYETLDLGVDLAREENVSLEQSQTTTTTRYGLTWTWRLSPRWTLAGIYSHARTEDDPRTSESSDVNLDLTLTWQLQWSRSEDHGVSGQTYLRYYDQDSDFLDRLFGFSNAREHQTVTAGLSLSLF